MAAIGQDFAATSYEWLSERSIPLLDHYTEKVCKEARHRQLHNHEPPGVRHRRNRRRVVMIDEGEDWSARDWSSSNAP